MASCACSSSEFGKATSFLFFFSLYFIYFFIVLFNLEAHVSNLFSLSAVAVSGARYPVGPGCGMWFHDS